MTSTPAEIRRDRRTGRSSLVVPARARRPGQDRATADAACPFCPGNEDLLPGIVWQSPEGDGADWRLRVVPNKFAVVAEDADAPSTNGPFARRAAVGRHEVIIEHPRHDLDMASMPPAHLRHVMAAYRTTYRRLSAMPGMRMTLLFRNHGAAAGASQQHPHAQAVALASMPPEATAERRRLRAYHRRTGGCAICDTLRRETNEGDRVVLQNDGFLAIVPFAAVAPCEVWLLPKRHRADFGDIDDDECAALAAALRDVLRRLRAALDDPPYNLAIQSAGRDAASAPHLHWYLRLVPGTTTPGGFELGTGLAINPSSPEADAALLRATQTVQGLRNPG